MDIQNIKDMLITYIEANGMRYVGAVIILFVGWVLSKWVGAVVGSALEKREKIDPMIINLLTRLAKAIVMIITVTAALGQCGVGTGSILAFLGAAGLAVGLALKDTFTNIAAGIMLLLLRPFSVGHAVNVGGTVYLIDQLGLFLTYAHIPDGPTVTIPNGDLWNSQLTNYSVTHNGLRRLNETIGISYGDDINKAMAVIQKILDEDERVLKDPNTLIGVSALGDSSVNLIVWAWVQRADWWQFKLDFTKRVKEGLDEAGITIPFPQRDLHVYKEKKK